MQLTLVVLWVKFIGSYNSYPLPTHNVRLELARTKLIYLISSWGYYHLPAVAYKPLRTRDC